MEEWFASVYGWPPDVTRRQEVDVLEKFPLIREAHARVANMRQKAAAKGPRGL